MASCRLNLLGGFALVSGGGGKLNLPTRKDRLLLGLKGTMSEAELHLLAGRLHGAKRAAAERGALRFPLPVGYVYDDGGATVLDPDEEIQAAVRDLFAAWAAICCPKIENDGLAL